MTIEIGTVRKCNQDDWRRDGKGTFELETPEGRVISCRSLSQFDTPPENGAEATVCGEWIAPGLLTISAYEVDD